MRINKKNLSVIILTSVLVISIVISILINSIEINKSTPEDTADTRINPSTSDIATEIIEIGGTTAIVPATTNKPNPSVTNNVIDDIIEDIYDKNKPVIINPSYGNNINTGSEDYDIDGTAVTTVYDTVESTKNGETTKPEPEATTTITASTNKPVDASAERIIETANFSEETTGFDNATEIISPEEK